MKGRTLSTPFAICINDGGYDVDLVVGKVYRVLPPHKNDPPSSLRVVDESGEDYLYSRENFVSVRLPKRASDALAAV
jgi:hypothetical protein